MTDTAAVPGEQALPLTLVSMASVLLGFAGLQLLAMYVAGVFEYPLDDVYIHLAMAEQIAAGGYGVNAGEYASAASSPLYPLLLLPFFGLEVQRYLPLLWNTLALAACGWLWGRILVQAGYDRQTKLFGLVLAVVVPQAINLPGIGYTGMEHAFHTAASLAIVYGLLRLLDDDVLSPLLIACIVLTPLIRFEGMALSLLAAGVVMLRGRPVAGGLAGVGAIAGLAVFMAFLVSLGLDPLPNSVQAKLGASTSETPLSGMLSNLQLFVFRRNGWILMAAAGAAMLMPLLVPAVNASPRRWLVRTILLALLAHMLFGKVGWMNRYENYILVASVAGLLALATGGGWLARLLALAPAMMAAFVYVPEYRYGYPFSSRGQHLQQAQMARLAQGPFDGSVAVNDLGRVAWGNSNYVLDLWGLGSAEALELRTTPAAPGWAEPLAERHGVDLAMIYDKWLKTAVGPGWVRLGTLELEGRKGYIADRNVAIYATSPEVVEHLDVVLSGWATDLPAGARYKPNTERAQ